MALAMWFCSLTELYSVGSGGQSVERKVGCSRHSCSPLCANKRGNKAGRFWRPIKRTAFLPFSVLAIVVFFALVCLREGKSGVEEELGCDGGGLEGGEKQPQSTTGLRSRSMGACCCCCVALCARVLQALVRSRERQDRPRDPIGRRSASGEQQATTRSGWLGAEVWARAWGRTGSRAVHSIAAAGQKRGPCCRESTRCARLSRQARAWTWSASKRGG